MTTFTPTAPPTVAVEVAVGTSATLIATVTGSGNVFNAGQVPLFIGGSGVTPVSFTAQVAPGAQYNFPSAGSYYACVAGLSGLATVATFPAFGGGSGGGTLVDLVAQFGIDNTGTVADNGPALNSAINALAQQGLGGFIKSPGGNQPAIVNIATPLVFGNGSSGTPSTIQAPILVGCGFSGATGFGNAPSQVYTWLKWTGGSSGSPVILTIAGPLSGWSLQNLYIDGQGTAFDGVVVKSGQFGYVRNLTVVGCTDKQIVTDLQAGPTSSVFNTMKNFWQNINVDVPAGAVGILLGNTFSASANNCFDKWLQVNVSSASGNPTVQTIGTMLASVDTINMESVTPGGYSGKWTTLYMNYSPSSGGWPVACNLIDWDFGNPAGVTGNGYIMATGSPSAGVRNHIAFVGSANGLITNLINTYGIQLGALGLDLTAPGFGFGTTALAAPSVPASGTAQANNWGVPVRVFVNGGTITGATQINGVSTGQNNGMFMLMPYDTIKLTYSAAPTWTWFGC